MRAATQARAQRGRQRLARSRRAPPLRSGLICWARAQVHNGVIFYLSSDPEMSGTEQAAASWTMNPACGHLVHLGNLFMARKRRSDYPSVNDTSYHAAIRKYITTLV
jgi:hypothetical protein